MAYGRITRRPSFGGDAARLKDCSSVSIWSFMPIPRLVVSYVVTLFPGPSGTETETDECGPCAALEEEYREDDAE